MRKIIKRRERPGTGRRCLGCDRSLPPAAFNPMATMPDGLCPWCRECVAGLAGGSARREREYKRDYSREYARERRLRLGVAWRRARVRVDGRGALKLRWSRARSELRITGRWGMLEDGLRCMTGPFGVPPGDVVERGRGGGSGSRRHETFVSTAPVGAEAWERGVETLRADGALVEGKQK